ncbi:unnamed protein product [Blepharisma stoltei]|uniref:Uncharacterized protein n=1 Tax=Blepharisma stoltei TaxID=1481888 RepID=A0AAU9J4J4_9CILI|nr:unnamed protein product [Blepharisma stoltei]
MRRKKIFGCYTNQTIKSCCCKDCEQSLMYLFSRWDDGSLNSKTAREIKIDLKLHKYGFLKPKCYKLEKLYLKKWHNIKSVKKRKWKYCEYVKEAKLDKEMMKNELRESLLLHSLQNLKVSRF